jgi:hypothetical protein
VSDFELLNDIDQYGELALRTLAPAIQTDTEKVVMNAATGLLSEVGEINDLILLSEGVELDQTHMKKEMGDWSWYWSLMCYGYGFKNSEVLHTKDVDEAAQHGIFTANHGIERAVGHLVVASGAIGEFVKKHYFHFHPYDKAHEQALAGLLQTAFEKWVGVITWLDGSPQEILGMNIAKLKARYPEGFTTERSLNRAPGDI